MFHRIHLDKPRNFLFLKTIEAFANQFFLTVKILCFIHLVALGVFIFVSPEVHTFGDVAANESNDNTSGNTLSFYKMPSFLFLSFF